MEDGFCGQRPCPRAWQQTEGRFQVAAATSAMKKAGLVMVQGYMHECPEKSAKEAGSKQKEPLKDFYRAISRYMNWN